MTRRSLIRLLLSLLLLTAQQMAFSHAMSHWAGQLGTAGQAHRQAGGHGDEASLSSAFAQGQSCDQCLAFAQIAGALGSHEHVFRAPACAGAAISGSAAVPYSARRTCAFQPRAPPAAI